MSAGLSASSGPGAATGVSELAEDDRKRLTRSIDDSMRRWIDAHPELDRAAINTAIPHLTDIAVERVAASGVVVPVAEVREAVAGVEALHEGMHKCGRDYWTDDVTYRGSIAKVGLCPTRGLLAGLAGED